MEDENIGVFIALWANSSGEFSIAGRDSVHIAIGGSTNYLLRLDGPLIAFTILREIDGGFELVHREEWNPFGWRRRMRFRMIRSEINPTDASRIIRDNSQYAFTSHEFSIQRDRMTEDGIYFFHAESRFRFSGETRTLETELLQIVLN